MSVWVTEEVVRRVLRICCRRSPWQRHGFPGTTSVKGASLPGQPLAYMWSSKWSRTCLDQSVSGPVRFYSNYPTYNEHFEEKEEVKPDAMRHRKVLSPLSDHLSRCGSPSDVLDLTCQYTPTAQQVSNCLSQMWNTTKKMPDEERRDELQLMFKHPAFEKLLQTAMRSVGYMRTDDMAYSLLSMVKLGVSQRSRVVQTFLRACQEKLNDLDEKSLSILSSCLEHMESSSNVTALKDGIRLVVELRFPEIKDVTALQNMMRLLRKDCPLSLKRKLEKKALSMTDQFTLPNSHSMISTLANMNFYSKPLLDVCSKKIEENLDGIPFNRLYKLLQSCRELKYKSVSLLNNISDHAASMVDVWTSKQIILLLSRFETGFCPKALLEAFAEKLIADPEALTLRDLLFVLKVYSSLNYDLQQQRQQFLDSLSRALDAYLPNMSGFDLLKSVYCLCLLGHFPSAPLEQLLQSSTLDQLKTTGPDFLRNQERMFQTISLCLRLDRPPLPRPLTVPAAFLGDSKSQSDPAVNLLLSQGLQSLLADQADIKLQEMVLEENVYLIDGVITKRLPNRTSETEARSEAGEESSPAESSQRIAVICAPQSGFCFGTSTPRGALAVKTRHLKILGYDPVLVMEQELQAVSEENRTEFLRGRIFPEHLGSDTRTETGPPVS